LERLAIDLVRVGVRRGHVLSVVCIEHRGRLAEMAESAGARVYCLGKAPGRSQSTIEEAAALLGAISPDVVHTHQIGALWYLGKAARMAGKVATVHTEHSDHVRQSQGVWRKLRSSARLMESAKLARRFCCVSDDVARGVRTMGLVASSHIRVVPNGIDVALYGERSPRAEIRREWKIPEGARVVGTLGRLNEVKRQDLLLLALAQLVRSHDDVWAVLVGDGPERLALEQLAAQQGIAHRVVFAGYQAEPQRFLAAFDIFALTSRHEGLPLALLEACAAALPVIAPDVGGIPSVIDHGRSGLLFPACDLPALTERLSQVLEDMPGARELGLEARDIVTQRYSLDAMADQYEKVYAEALAA